MTQRLTSKSAPLYAQVADDLRIKILSGQWLPGERIPPELELCKQYRVSRITVRSGIERLVSERLLVRKRAKGSFVRNWDTDERTEEHLTLASSSQAGIQELGQAIHTRYAALERAVPNSRIRRILELDEGEEALVLHRIRGAEDRPFGLFFTWFTPIAELPRESSAYYGSFAAILREHGIVPDRSKDSIEAVRPSLEVQQALMVSPNTPILKRTRIAWQLVGPYREFNECFYVGDQYKYYVDFS